MAATVGVDPRTQRLEALQVANRVRTMRAQLKRDIAAGRARAVDYLLDPPEFAASMEVYDLLCATPRRGRHQVTRALQRVRVSPHRTLAGPTPTGLTDGERRRIADAIQGW